MPYSKPALRNRIRLVLSFSLLFQSYAFAQSSVSQPPANASPFDSIHRLTEQGKFDEALSALAQISNSNPSAKNLSHEFGVTYYRKGDRSEEHTSELQSRGL